MQNIRSLFKGNNFIDGYNQGKMVAFGFIAAFINLGFGILISIFSHSLILYYGFLIELMPFIVSLVLFLGAWLALKGWVKQSFDLVLSVFLFEILIYALTTTGFGLFLGITVFCFLSTTVVEIAPQPRLNRTMLLTGIFSTLVFLLDFYGPDGRYEASGILLLFLPYILVVEIGVYLVVLARQYSRLTLVTKLIIPIVIILYVSIGIMTVFNYLANANMINNLSREGLGVGSEPSQLILYNLLQNQVRLNALFAVMVLLVVTLAAFGIIRLITNPIRELTALALKVTQGKLNVHTDISSKDEIGTLAQAFNLMTSQLRLVMDTLEQRINERTRELNVVAHQARTRSLALENLSDINREISFMRQIDQLLPLIPRMISESFGHYHVGIYLSDPKQEYAVLRAASSEEGFILEKRGYRVKQNQDSLVGSVALLGESKVVLEIKPTSVSYNYPDFPETRSQAAFPLKVGDKVIGVLDVHSTQPSAFLEEEIAILVILADQVAAAIDNANAFSLMLSTQSYSIPLQQNQQEGLIAPHLKRQTIGYQYNYGVISPLEMHNLENNLPLWENLEKDGSSVVQPTTTVSTQEAALINQKKIEVGLLTLAVPISLRGEVIGAIQLEEVDPGRIWTDDEINMVKLVANQVGLALENASLLEQTQRRVEREATVARITSRLHANKDPNEIMQTAVSELRQALRAKIVHIVIPDDTNEIQPEADRSETGNERS